MVGFLDTFFYNRKDPQRNAKEELTKHSRPMAHRFVKKSIRKPHQKIPKLHQKIPKPHQKIRKLHQEILKLVQKILLLVQKTLLLVQKILKAHQKILKPHQRILLLVQTHILQKYLLIKLKNRQMCQKFVNLCRE